MNKRASDSVISLGIKDFVQPSTSFAHFCFELFLIIFFLKFWLFLQPFHFIPGQDCRKSSSYVHIFGSLSLHFLESPHRCIFCWKNSHLSCFPSSVFRHLIHESVEKSLFLSRILDYLKSQKVLTIGHSSKFHIIFPKVLI